MDRDPDLRPSPNTARLAVGAVTAAALAVALAFSQAEGSMVDCDPKGVGSLNWAVCPIVDVGTALKNTFVDGLSGEMTDIP